MSNRIETLEQALRAAFDGKLVQVVSSLGELTVEVKGADMHGVARSLRDLPEFAFSQLIDLCGLDYLDYAHRDPGAPRFAVVYHLLSIQHNRRLRVRASCADDDLPRIDSVVDLWPSADWFEREAFDLYGIVFEGHPDLRRILTDYGFIGHPFRKDFPLSGNVEMRYDPDQQRVIYQPVTIEPREITPRVVREENYAEGPGFRNG